MNRSLTLLFFEDYFIASVQPDELAWEELRVNGSSRQELHFYITEGKEIRNDDYARQRFREQDLNAYGNFYQIIQDTSKTFTYFEIQRPVIHLLKGVMEQLKRACLEKFKADDLAIAVNPCFIPGVPEMAKKIILDYLAVEGFRVNPPVEYVDAFLSTYARKGIIDRKANLTLVDSYFGDLYFHYLEYEGALLKQEQLVLPGKGADNRVAALARLMVEKAAKKQFSRILNDKTLLEEEVKKFHDSAAAAIRNFFAHELEVQVNLSDYTSSRVVIDERELDKYADESFNYIKYHFEQFLNKHSSLVRNERIVLNGLVLASEVFVKFFQKAYGAPKVLAPLPNFAELLSGGVFTLSQEQGEPNDPRIEIKVPPGSSVAIVKPEQVKEARILPPVPPLPANVVKDAPKPNTPPGRPPFPPVLPKSNTSPKPVGPGKVDPPPIVKPAAKSPPANDPKPLSVGKPPIPPPSKKKDELVYA